MRTLVQRGLLESERGPSGGYRLNRPPNKITVADVIEALDGPIACNPLEVTECLRPSDETSLERSLAGWASYAQERFQRVSLADLK
jgi:Rrf2 family protein